MKNKDSLFSAKMDETDLTFRFDEKVAKVFDDMASRSVPQYHYQQKLVAKLACYYYQAGTAVYDLGCATGNTLLEMRKSGLKDARLIGVDASSAMLDRARKKKLEGVELVCSGIEEVEIQNASVVLMVYTLQFLPLHKRLDILKGINKGLVSGGCLVLCEKVKPETETTGEPLEKIYEEFKKENEYSALEIEQKKKALRDVLEPATMNENLKLLADASFKKVEIFFKALQFCGFVAVKE